MKKTLIAVLFASSLLVACGGATKQEAVEETAQDTLSAKTEEVMDKANAAADEITSKAEKISTSIDSLVQ